MKAYIHFKAPFMYLSFPDLFNFLHMKEQNSRHLEEHRETEDTSEKTSPNKNLKSPQRGSKRLKTSPFKVALLDSSEYEGEIEVC